MLLKGKQLDFITLVSNFISYLEANPTSRNYFTNLSGGNVIQTTPNPSYINTVVFSNITNTTVDLAWDPITNASGYEIEIQEFGNLFSTQRISNVTSTSYTVTTLNPSSTYDILVKAVF